MNDPRARLRTLLGAAVAGVGADLEDLQVSPAGRRRVVRVVVDRDGGVSLDDVAALSRTLSVALDDLDAREPELLDGAYVLEVSSPGVDRPLTEVRHWRRNVSRLVTATLRAGGTVTGRVLRVDRDGDGDGMVTLDVSGRERVLVLADVTRATVKVEFDRAGPQGHPDPDPDEDADADDDLDDDEDAP